MVKLLKKLDLPLLKLIKSISNLADELGCDVYLVGGFVRDILLKRKNLDLDITIDALASPGLKGGGIDFALKLAKKLKADVVTHGRFGTATITCRDGIKIDVATARKETYPKQAELPRVSAGTIRDDLKRRDFSINALAVNLNKKDFGKMLDWFKGQADIKKRCIRILHNRSFIDDPTRILRGIRFEQRFGFKFDKDTKMLVKKAKKMRMIKKVHKHRLRDEIILILKEEQPLKVILRLKSLYGLRFIHKAIKVDQATERLFRGVRKKNRWFKDNFPQKRELDEWLVYFIILLRKLKRRDILKLCHDFAFRKGIRKIIISYNDELGLLRRSLDKKHLKPSNVYQLLEPLSYEAIIAVLATIENKRAYKHVFDFLRHYDEMKLHINGHDLKNIGIKPGPHFKGMLEMMLYEKLDKKLSHKEELSFLKHKLDIK